MYMFHVHGKHMKGAVNEQSLLYCRFMLLKHLRAASAETSD